jgi:hypothetical protein
MKLRVAVLVLGAVSAVLYVVLHTGVFTLRGLNLLAGGISLATSLVLGGLLTDAVCKLLLLRRMHFAGHSTWGRV